MIKPKGKEKGKQISKERCLFIPPNERLSTNFGFWGFDSVVVPFSCLLAYFLPTKHVKPAHPPTYPSNYQQPTPSIPPIHPPPLPFPPLQIPPSPTAFQKTHPPKIIITIIINIQASATQLTSFFFLALFDLVLSLCSLSI